MSLKTKSALIAAVAIIASGCTTVTGPISGAVKNQFYGELSMSGSAANEEKGTQYKVSGSFPAQPAVGQVIEMTGPSGEQFCSMRVVDALYKDQAAHQDEINKFKQVINPQTVFGVVYMDCPQVGEGYIHYIIKYENEKYNGYIDGRAGNLALQLKMVGDGFKSH